MRNGSKVAGASIFRRRGVIHAAGYKFEGWQELLWKEHLFRNITDSSIGMRRDGWKRSASHGKISRHVVYENDWPFVPRARMTRRSYRRNESQRPNTVTEFQQNASLTEYLTLIYPRWNTSVSWLSTSEWAMSRKPPAEILPSTATLPGQRCFEYWFWYLRWKLLKIDGNIHIQWIIHFGMMYLHWIVWGPHSFRCEFIGSCMGATTMTQARSSLYINPSVQYLLFQNSRDLNCR